MYITLLTTTTVLKHVNELGRPTVHAFLSCLRPSQVMNMWVHVKNRNQKTWLFTTRRSNANWTLLPPHLHHSSYHVRYVTYKWKKAFSSNRQRRRRHKNDDRGRKKNDSPFMKTYKSKATTSAKQVEKVLNDYDKSDSRWRRLQWIDRKEAI